MAEEPGQRHRNGCRLDHGQRAEEAPEHPIVAARFRRRFSIPDRRCGVLADAEGGSDALRCRYNRITGLDRPAPDL